MKRTTLLFFAVILLISSLSAKTQTDPVYLGDIMLQGFGWDEYSQTKISSAGNYYKFIQSKASELKAAGFDMIWMPPASKSSGGTGYIPTELYDFNSTWGSSTDLTAATAALKTVGIHPIADVVVNHRGSATDWSTFTNPAWSAATICSTDELNTNWVASRGPKGTGAADEGQDFSGARDLDHTNAEVQAGVKAYLTKLKEQGFEGWRWDMVKGFNGSHVYDYNTASTPYFSVGENWDGATSVLTSWINATGGTSAAFDFALYYKIQDAFNGNWGSMGSGTTMGGLAGTYGYSEKAVTFVDNHDTFVTAGAPGGENIMKGYAFILTHPGIPCVFLPHYYGGTYTKDGVTRTFDNNKAKIDELMAVRKANGIDAWSSISVSNTSGYYAATIKKRYADTDPVVAVCIGTTSWTPTGSGWIVASSGTNYKVWSKTAILTAPTITPSAGTYFYGQTVTLTASSGATIRYTLDGSTPTATSAIYTNPITLASGTPTIKAIATASGVTSAMVSNTYTINYKSSSMTLRFKAPDTWTGCAIWIWETVNGTVKSLNTKQTWPGDQITKVDNYYTYTCTNFTQPTVGIVFNNNVASGTSQTIDLSASGSTCWDAGVLSGGKYTAVINATCGVSAVETPEVETWKLYPNPTKGKVQISLPENVTKITVTSALGMQINLPIPSSQSNSEIDLSAYSSGIYYITVWTKDGSRLTKPVVKMQ